MDIKKKAGRPPTGRVKLIRRVSPDTLRELRNVAKLLDVPENEALEIIIHEGLIRQKKRMRDRLSEM